MTSLPPLLAALLAFAVDVPPRVGPVRNLSCDPGTDEDGSLILDEAGTLHFAWMSDRAGDMDIWMASSRDGVRWSAPRIAVQTRGPDLLNSLTRTSDGLYHLTGRRGSSVWDSHSEDLHGWSEPVEWTDPRQGWSAGTFQETADGHYCLVTISKRAGNHDLVARRSTDRGATWSEPVRITDDPREDFYFSFRRAPDGTLLLAWERHEAGDRAGLYGRSTDLYLATSPDGAAWSAPTLVTPEARGERQVDTIPALIEGPGGRVFLAWITTRVDGTPTPVMVPVWPTLERGDLRRIPAPGYAIRSQPLPDGRVLLVWVANPTRTGSDYFGRIVSDFEFEPAGSSESDR